MESKSNRQFFDGIQALRLVAALLVVATHATFYTNERLDPGFSIWRAGAIGVDVFFIISGFVMMATSAKLAESRDGWKTFAHRRLLRIVPMYWLVTSIKIVLMLLIPAMVLHAELSPWRIVSSYLFLPSTNPEGRLEPLVGVGWTLIFEMFFYAVFAFALFIRANVIAFVGIVLGLCGLIGLFRQPDWPAATMYLDPVVFYFLFGMAFYVVAGKVRASVLAPVSALLLAGTLMLAFALDLPVVGAANSIAALGISTSLVLFIVSIEPWINGKVPRPLLFLGEASYVLYLFHPLIAPGVPEVLKRFAPAWVGPWTSVLLCMIVSLVAASFIHMLIEKPTTRWLKRRTTPRLALAVP